MKNKITTYKGYDIMVSEDSNGKPYYYIRKHKTLTFDTVDEAEDYIDLLTK